MGTAPSALNTKAIRLLVLALLAVLVAAVLTPAAGARRPAAGGNAPWMIESITRFQMFVPSADSLMAALNASRADLTVELGPSLPTMSTHGRSNPA